MIFHNLVDGEQYINIQGIKHWCKVAGAKYNTVPLIVVHGGPGGNHYVFERTIGPRIESFTTVIYYEQRGSGRSQEPEDENDYSIDTLVRDLEMLRMALGVPKINLLGYSFGAQLCLEYALKYPAVVGKLILQAPTIGDYERMYQIQLKGFASVAQGKIKQRIDALNHTKISLTEKYNQVWNLVDTATVDRLLFVNQKYAKLNRDLWEESGLVNTGKMAEVLFRSRPCISLFDRVENIKASTVIMVGKYDRNTGVKMSEDLAKAILSSHLIMFEQSAHFPDIEEEEKFSRVIWEFLNK
ncbi:alpha/beta fold hydrolase [Bacillus cereus]|uniref:alpha/beta fold hydrolase n=1 Tax=Bacillus cereus TaxID=1396 RepID=UPI00356D195B